MANIKIGWIFYAEGTGPEKIWDPSPTQMAPKPNDARKFKRGFLRLLFLALTSSPAPSSVLDCGNFHQQLSMPYCANQAHVCRLLKLGLPQILAAFRYSTVVAVQIHSWKLRYQLRAAIYPKTVGAAVKDTCIR